MARNRYDVDEMLETPFDFSHFKRSFKYMKKYRGKMNAVYRQYVTEMLEGKKIRPGHIFITESGEIDPAVIADLEKLVLEKSGCRELHHTLAGCTVSTHCGPGTLGVLFIEE